MQGTSLRTHSFLICDSTVGVRLQTIGQYELYCSHIQEPILDFSQSPSMRLYCTFVLVAVSLCAPTEKALLVVQHRSIEVDTINISTNIHAVKDHSAGEERNGPVRKCNGAPLACTVTVQAAYSENRVRRCLETSCRRVVQRRVSTRAKG